MRNLLIILTLMANAAFALDCNVKNRSDAKKCAIKLAKSIRTGNDDNAVFLTTSKKARSLLIELLKSQKVQNMNKEILTADYLITVVQNDDEAHLHYFTLNNGNKTSPKALLDDYGINTVDLAMYVCDFKKLSEKYLKTSNVFLGADPKSSLLGIVWFEDTTCSDY